MSLELPTKYDLNVPRYTSYPTVPYWSGAPMTGQWIKGIEDSSLVDLYIHIPYCKQLCFYCGCFKTISKSESKATKYVELLIKEWEIYLKSCPNLRINSIHFGGGTPTFLSAGDFDRLLSVLVNHYDKNFTGSIELDPRTTNTEQMKVLKSFQFRRASLGIQDFNEEVQVVINRVQSRELVSKVVADLQAHGFESINFDLIYGLPKQTKETIRETIGEVIKMAPDLIAFYSYAHLPEKIPSQRIFKDKDLPVGKQKKELYDYGKKILEDSGYAEIGLDHFALKDSFLYQAFNKGKLLRSFMGYTDKKAQTMIGLGLSSISQTKSHYAQNSKDLKEYQDCILAGNLSLSSGHTFSGEDQLRDQIIQKWMCGGRVEFSEIEKLSDFNKVKDQLDGFKADGLVDYLDGYLILGKRGKPYLRVIASSFDEYLTKTSNKKVQFSSTI